MKYLTLDIETGGLEPETSSLLEIGLVYRRGEEFDAVRVVFIPDEIVLNAYCAHLNRGLLDEMHQVEQTEWWKELLRDGFTYGCVKPGEPEALSPWVSYYSLAGGHGYQAFHAALTELGVDISDEARTVVAGKNVAGFDLPFLNANGLMEMAPNGDQFRVHRRTLDPALGLMLPTDDHPPDLATCLERADLPPVDGAHTAVADALAVDSLIWRQILGNEAYIKAIGP